MKSYSTTSDSSVIFSLKDRLYSGYRTQFQNAHEKIQYHEQRICEKAKAIGQYIAKYDFVMICGGGIISYHPYYLEHICGIISACEHQNVPLYINSVGIEEYNVEDEEFPFWKEFLNKSCIRSFTTRDYIEELRKDWITNTNIRTDFVPDNVLMLSRTMNDDIPTTSDTIGIGVIMSDVYKNSHDTDKKQKLVDFYIRLAQTCDDLKVKYEFFTNGVPMDSEYIPYIETELKKKVNVRIPSTIDELIGNICRYKGLITARMHSMIIAYSMNIPFVALDWRKKVRAFNDIIGNSDCCFSLENINPSKCIELLETKAQENSNNSCRQTLQHKIEEEIERIITEW